MKKLSKKRGTIAFAIMAMALTSCNRGVGCPSDFSMGEFTQNIVETFTSFVQYLF